MSMLVKNKLKFEHKLLWFSEPACTYMCICSILNAPRFFLRKSELMSIQFMAQCRVDGIAEVQPSNITPSGQKSNGVSQIAFLIETHAFTSWMNKLICLQLPEWWHQPVWASWANASCQDLLAIKFDPLVRKQPYIQTLYKHRFLSLYIINHY